ncbi:MAG: protein-L-isoaspartate O-methyltransferase [Gammaproteobacteria bacterium]
MMNIEEARTRMLDQQIRAWEVLDSRVLDVLGRIPRELFVPAAYRKLAFADTDIPIAHGQRMMFPKIEGRLLQALQLQPAHAVLEIGTGTGFLTACLAQLAKKVVSVEIFDDMTQDAEIKLRGQGIKNVELQTADAWAFPHQYQFDAVAVTGSVPEMNNHFVRMLRPGGKLFIIIGKAPVMDACLITQHDSGEWARESLFETVVPPLINAEQREPFLL